MSTRYPEVKKCAHCDGPCYTRFCCQQCAEARYDILIHALHRLRRQLDGAELELK